MAIESLEQLFEAFKNQKVLIIGDVMIDEYIWGKVERISPEAPVPVVRTYKKDYRLGGAANVALNVHSLGGQPILCSIIGDDEDGHKFIQRLKDRDITARGIVKGVGRKTPVKTRVLSGSQHLLRVDSETDDVLNEIEEKSVIQHIHSLMEDCDVIVFQDYDKGTISAKLIRDTIEMAKKKSIPVVVDPKKRNFLEYKGATLFKPNLKELKEGLNLDFNSDELDEVKEAMSQLKTKLALENVLVTLSEKGVIVDTGKEVHHIPAHIRSISDVSGAGDTVISIVSLCFGLGLSPKLSAQLANLGGGLVCESLGVVPIEKELLFKEALAGGLDFGS